MASVMSFPTRIVHGKGSIRELPNELKRAGATRPLLVTDKGILQAGLLRFVSPLLEQAGMKVQVFTEFAANPTDADAVRGVEAYRAAGADSVLGVGGAGDRDPGLRDPPVPAPAAPRRGRRRAGRPGRVRGAAGAARIPARDAVAVPDHRLHGALLRIHGVGFVPAGPRRPRPLARGNRGATARAPHR